MYVYVAHEYGGKAENVERAKKITHDLQIADRDNVYICPILAFSHLEYGELGYDEEIDLCKDLMCIFDKMIVASKISEGVRREIEFAQQLHWEVDYLEDNR